MLNRKSGFTLIEMMVVVLIIALLATMILVESSYARKKSRDLQRMADLTRFAGALENYYADNSQTGYPTDTFDSVVATYLFPTVGTKYLDSGITNPYPTTDYSQNIDTYVRDQNNPNNYHLYFQVEIQSNASCLNCNGHGDIFLIKNGKKSNAW